MPFFNATLIFAEVDGALGGSASPAELLAAAALTLEDKFGPTAPAQKHAEWTVSSVVLAIELGMVLAAMGVKVWMGNGWLFRRVETAGGVFVGPNFGFVSVSSSECYQLLPQAHTQYLTCRWICIIALFLAGLQVSLPSADPCGALPTLPR